MAVEWKEFVVEVGEQMDIHQVPTDGAHELSRTCWCKPEFKYDAEEDITTVKHVRVQ